MSGGEPSRDLLVSIANTDHRLTPGTVFTFGRSEACTVCLDPLDRGISRLAGAIVHEHGGWWVVNRSETRTLTIIDALGLKQPLPVVRPGLPPSKRAVDPGGVRILVAGSVWTHNLVCVHAEPVVQSSITIQGGTATTMRQLPNLTPARKLVLVAMVSGYLQAHPRHDPNPRTYAEISEMTGVPKPAVMRRIESVRDQLRAAGVPDLEVLDARRPLAEWLLAMRLIVEADLALLPERKR